MTIDDKLTAAEIVSEGGKMSARPEFYSGRGATYNDLDGQMLERFYQRIGKVHGKDAAQNFAKMVADIPVLSATDFLLSLYRLEGNDWKWDKKLLGREKGLYAGDYPTGFATVVNVLGGSMDRDDTGAIRNLFLRDHGIKVPQPKRTTVSSYGGYSTFSDEWK